VADCDKWKARSDEGVGEMCALKQRREVNFTMHPLE
jgi:hypothetical protein